jgi:hypothetical protein
MKLLAEIREALIVRVFRRRLQERWDKGFLAGIDTAEMAVGTNPSVARAKIRTAREGFLEEVRSR